jgi:hypothetical protein
MLPRTLIWLACLTALAGTLPDLESPVVRTSTRVAFTHRSSAKSLQVPDFEITNSITNNSRTDPLSVRWDWGRILCVGFLQIPPGATDSGIGSYIVAKPIEKGSEIKFGVGLGQTVAAQVYVDKREVDDLQKPKTTEYVRRVAGGSVAFDVKVYSAIYDQQHMKLQVHVEGGLSLAIPMKLGGYLKEPLSRFPNGDWRTEETESLERFGLRDGSYRQLATEWLRTNDQVGYYNLVILKNLNSKSSDFTVDISGKTWSLQKINLLAFNSERTGMIGLTVDVYLPMGA